MSGGGDCKNNTIQNQVLLYVLLQKEIKKFYPGKCQNLSFVKRLIKAIFFPVHNTNRDPPLVHNSLHCCICYSCNYMHIRIHLCGGYS